MAGFSVITTAAGVEATRRYVDLAQRRGLKPAQMVLAYVNSRPFLTSTIIGAAGMEQLAENLTGAELEAPQAVLEEIEDIHSSRPNPCPLMARWNSTLAPARATSRNLPQNSRKIAAETLKNTGS